MFQQKPKEQIVVDLDLSEMDLQKKRPLSWMDYDISRGYEVKSLWDFLVGSFHISFLSWVWIIRKEWNRYLMDLYFFIQYLFVLVFICARFTVSGKPGRDKSVDGKSVDGKSVDGKFGNGESSNGDVDCGYTALISSAY